MDILCIGNSFSQDACKYLHDMAKASGKEVNTLNLYIGGCSLETHAYNIFFNKPYYQFEYNGVDAKELCRMGTIQEALTERDWDYISIQQVSNHCGNFESYQPHLNRIISRVRDVRPNSKLLIHQTWSYDPASPRYPSVYANNTDMYNKLKDAYSKAAKAINATDIIPCGDVIEELRTKEPFDLSKGGISLHRDGFHLSLTYGRYAAAATWYHKLVGDVLENEYIPDYEDIDIKILDVIKQTVSQVCK